jgi:hypothetical protein
VNTITVNLADHEAGALAQMCKRFTYEHAQGLANHHDGGLEATPCWTPS